MNKETGFKIKKYAGFATPVALAFALITEYLRSILPQSSSTPTELDYKLTVWRNAFLIIMAICFTVFLFLIIKKRLGILKAVFYTILSDSLIVFALGTAMMLISSAKNITATGISAIESIYYYLLGIMIMIGSAAAFATALLIFLVLLLVRYIIRKSKEDKTK